MAKPLIKPKVKQTQTGDPFFRDILDLFTHCHGSYVEIGILQPNRRYPSEEAVKGDTPTLGQVAAWQEFGTHSKDGTPIVPSRSFIRAPMDHGRRGIERLKERLVQGVIDKKIPLKKAYEAIGQDAVRRMQNAILGRIPPALKPATIRRRTDDQGTIPLYRTKWLFKSIAFSVTMAATPEVKRKGK